MKLAFASLFLIACSSADGAPTGPTGRLSVSAAALTFTGVVDADYDLSVYNGAGALVWREQHLRASRFGSGASLSYVGPCDASAGVAENRVELIVNALDDADGPLPTSAWRNPTADGPLTRTVTCVADADVAVAFDVTIMRGANQGFFDVGVELDQIFCSAKVDCVDALLLDPSGTRGPTVVVGFTCTSGDARPTYLHYTDVALVCGDHTTWLSPADGPGNLGAQAPTLFGASTYRHETDLGAVEGCAWNLSLGLDEGPGAASCVLRAKATATSAPLVEHGLGERVYPVVSIEVPLTDAAGQMTCGHYPLDGTPTGVATSYSHGGQTFPYSWQCGGGVTRERQLCGATSSEPVAIVSSPTGVRFERGASSSPSYTLGAGLHVDGCCSNPCPSCQ